MELNRRRVGRGADPWHRGDLSEAEGWRREGRCSCRCITTPRAEPRTLVPLDPRRPIAKFNAKVMRERVRLRAAMQERPTARLAVSTTTTPMHTASRLLTFINN
ncbi:unnamed protein product [Colias eurytheme]|nr:unnamed protein product [Colias eurytheme]